MATKTVWASPFHTSEPNSPQSKWAGCKEGEESKLDQQLECVDIYPLKSVHMDRVFILLFDKNDSGVLAVFAYEQHLTSTKNAMEQEFKKNGERNANEMGGPSPPLISHLY